MAKIAPFRGIVYNESKAGAIETLVCPPYDIISPAEQQELYRKSPYNVIRLEYGLTSPADSDEDNRYTRAATVLEDWSRTTILQQRKDPAFYVYEMEYKAGKAAKNLRGIICLVRIEDYDSGIVKPHETTLSGPKTDRLNLLRSVQSELQPDILALLGPPGHGCKCPCEGYQEA